MTAFLEKAVEAVSTARDFAVVLSTGGLTLLGDGIWNVLPGVDPSVGALGVAAVALGAFKAGDAVRSRGSATMAEAEERQARLRSERRADVIAFAEVLDADGDRDQAQRLRRVLGLTATGAVPESALDDVLNEVAADLAADDQGTSSIT